MAAKGFSFDTSKSFGDNFDAFLAELESVDKELVAVLRANADLLAEVVHNGERDPIARAKLNAEIAKALDALVVPAAGDA